MKIIILKNGKHFLIDNEDFKYVSQFHWLERKSKDRFYIVRSTSRREGKRKQYLLHREIMNCPKGMVVDHIDGDTYNNTRKNLRICTHQQNMFNQKTQTRKKTSKYKGVHWLTREKKWRAKIKHNQKSITLGYFDCEEKAAFAYNEKAKELFGEFACLN